MVIGYWGRALSTAEEKWPITQLELLAVARGMLAFNFYLEHNHFTLITDYFALDTILKEAIKPPNLERLALMVQSFDYAVEHRPGSEMGLPDALSRSLYDMEFDEELGEARHLGVIVKSQEMREAEWKDFYEKEGVIDPEDATEDNPLSRY